MAVTVGRRLLLLASGLLAGMVLRGGQRLAPLLVAMLALLLLTPAPAVPTAGAAPAPAEEWSTDSSFKLEMVGRDSLNGSVHYRVTASWGATFFGIASESMPLTPPQEAVGLLEGGFKAAFPDRDPRDLKPDDSFEFSVQATTPVCAQWRQTGTQWEYRSLLGDSLMVYHDPRSPIDYRLVRADNPNQAEVMLNQEADLKPYPLAQSLFGPGDPNFKPDFLQVKFADDAIQGQKSIVQVDLTKPHLDDFSGMRATTKPGGKTQDGLDIYWFRSDDSLAQPLFRVDDAVGDGTDLSKMPSLIRVYYYKDGVVRTYQRASDTLFLSGRSPQNQAWATVFAQNGGANPPTKWDIGQPEQDAAAQELEKLGIVVLRYQVKSDPPGNFFTQILDLLMSLMNRKQS